MQFSIIDLKSSHLFRTKIKFAFNSFRFSKRTILKHFSVPNAKPLLFRSRTTSSWTSHSIIKLVVIQPQPAFTLNRCKWNQGGIAIVTAAIATVDICESKEIFYEFAISSWRQEAPYTHVSNHIFTVRKCIVIEGSLPFAVRRRSHCRKHDQQKWISLREFSGEKQVRIKLALDSAGSSLLFANKWGWQARSWELGPATTEDQQHRFRAKKEAQAQQRQQLRGS